MKTRFESQGAGTWAPLSERYAARKARHYPGKPLLRATDRLFNSLVSESADCVFQPSAGRLAMGTSLAYAAYHECGSPRTNLPRRSVFDFAKDSSKLTAIARPFGSFAREMARALGFGSENDENGANYTNSVGMAASAPPLSTESVAGLGQLI